MVPANASRLKTVKEPMFHFKSEVKKEWSPNSRSQAGGVLSLTGWLAFLSILAFN